MHGIKIEQPFIMITIFLIIDLLSIPLGRDYGVWSFPIVSFILVLWISGYVSDFYKLKK